MGVANVMFQDSQHLIEVVMQIIFYVTPIIYLPQLLCEIARHLAWSHQLESVCRVAWS